MSDGKNMVTVNCGGMQYDVDVERGWRDFKEESFEDQLDSAVSSFFWMSHIFGVDLPQEIKNKFWKEFERPKAERAREVAVYGLRHVNNLSLFNLLKDAMDFTKNRDGGAYVNNAESGRMKLHLLGLRFAELASKKDHKDFRRMADMIQAGGIADGDKGGEDSLNGQIVRDFCQFVANFRTLPTKKQLRESLGIPDDDKSKQELFRKALRELGLSGLPQAGELRKTQPEN